METIIDKINRLTTLINEEINEIDELIESRDVMVGTTVPDEIDDIYTMKFKVPVEQQDMFFGKISAMMPDVEFDILQDGIDGVVEIVTTFDQAEVIADHLGAQFAFNIDGNDVSMTDPLITFDITRFVDKVGYDVDESITKKKVIRHGKREIKVVTDKKNHKIQIVGKKPVEVKMTKQEIKNRRKAAIKVAKHKSSSDKLKSQKQRAKSTSKVSL